MTLIPKGETVNNFYKHWKQAPTAEFKARWPNFSPQEIACKGTGEIKLNFDALDRLQKLRMMLGKPLIINSAYRSVSHNRNVGGATNSNHMQGVAFDINMANHDPVVFERTARSLGFNGIGHYPGSNFMHIDTRSKLTRWKGTGSNNRWFFTDAQYRANTATATAELATPAYPAAPPTKTTDTLKELAPVLAPAIIAPIGALSSGEGPVQWAFGCVIVVLVLVGAWWFVKRQRASQEGEPNA